MATSKMEINQWKCLSSEDAATGGVMKLKLNLVISLELGYNMLIVACTRPTNIRTI